MEGFRRFNGKTTVFENSNVVDVAIRDLELVLKFQKSTFEDFYFYLDNIENQDDTSIHTLPTKMSNMINASGRKIRTTELSISTGDKSNLIKMLQFADPETLKIIQFDSMDDSIQLELVVNLNVEDIRHFSRITMAMNSISARDLDSLRKVFLISSKFEKLGLELRMFHEKEELLNLWGAAFNSEYSKEWCFRMKDSAEKALCIRIYQYVNYHIRFNTFELGVIPNGIIYVGKSFLTNMRVKRNEMTAEKKEIVLTLRQVCRDFRNFIDDLNDSKLPDSKFKQIEIVSVKDENKIFFSLVDFDVNYYLIDYSESENSRNFQGKTVVFENSNIVDVAIRDLELVLRFQKPQLERLYFDVDDFQLLPDSLLHNFPVKLSNMFKMLNRRIKTDNLTIETYNKSQIMRLIPFADSDALRKLILLAKDDDMKLEIDEIVKTEQWKKAQEIHCDFHVFNLNVNDICHFSRITLTMKTIPAKDFEILRNTFISSPKFEHAFFELTHFNEKEEISNVWGISFNTGSSSNWYFRIKDLEEEVLHIEFRGKFINFHTIHWRNVLTGARVQDYNEN
ncbi:Protein CBG04960 [Caenorhabditis briggsae]|uniref:Protein CBG04960 n=1 Tax=Caenorhabditis briggsae TaxID=6238 RepID=A8WYW4_CAEBR|nr:Protein CBG04960 [Caenorhabditis briggsae]CAP25572.1 Protein CBG04960 [Caenorhabditis briggsae]